MKKYFKPNWKGINNALALPSDNEERKEFFGQWHRLQKLMKEKIDQAFRDKLHREAEEKIAELKRLPPGSMVYYNGNDERGLGLGCIKVKDNLKYMSVNMGEASWKIAYSSLRLMPLSDEELKTKKAIIGFAKKVF